MMSTTLRIPEHNTPDTALEFADAVIQANDAGAVQIARRHRGYIELGAAGHIFVPKGAILQFHPWPGITSTKWCAAVAEHTNGRALVGLDGVLCVGTPKVYDPRTADKHLEPVEETK